MEVLNGKNYINQIAIDCVVFGYEDGQLKILISQLKYKGDFYALPNGFIFQEENTDAAAHRILQERTGLKDIYLEEFKVFGKADRNNKAFLDKLIELNYADTAFEQTHNPMYEWLSKRFISIGYYALVNIKAVEPQLTEIDKSLEWYNIHELPPMIMDGNEIAQAALKTLQRDIDEKLNVFNLLPEKFTMKEVQDIYESVFERAFVRTNFQKKILDLNVLERLEKKFTGAKNKAPYLYKLK
ncbi:MAG: NUDIX hydrolase [Saprospiraceae bacterium]|nr:NUDIX hydrolase [Saprospiraceae bacterium]